MKLTLIALLTAFCLMSVPAIAAGPAEWPITEAELDNGLKVIILEDHSTPAVTSQIWYHVGSKNERPGITGISHLFEHMMFKGSKNIPPEEHARIVQKNGGTSNAYTYFDQTVYHETLGNEKLDLALSLEAERMQNLTIDDKNLASERQVIIEERGWRIDNNPFMPIVEQLFATSYNAHPYGWHVIGWMSDLESITLDDCRNYFDTYYVPNNATLVIAGDVNPKDAMQLVEKHFGAIPRGAEPPRPHTVEPVQMGERRVEFHKQAQLPVFIAGYHTPEMLNEDTYALDVLSRVFSGGQSSRAYKRLVYDEQICLFAGGQFETREDPALFYVFAFMNPGATTETAEAALYDELEKIKNEPLTDHELQKAKNQIEAELVGQMESIDDKAQMLGQYQTLTGDYRNMFGEMDKYMAVTADDVMRVAKKYFDSRNRTVVTLVPEQSDAGMGFGL
ncbi:MAG: insulinase family protein [candidate division Zixibacteria bacterium]|nr:insulinase family protein [candidate division Zixibacteria bacterium]MBU1470482.1 insulinase family protein [candidate division Zixibacteria bacterium]MBU2625931.1 insulinase family protein [candidate division Zixibacteria bacterium]